MKAKTLGLVHTSATLVPVFQKLCSEYLPNVNVFNIVDDSLIKDVISRNELTKLTSRRVVDHADHISRNFLFRVFITGKIKLFRIVFPWCMAKITLYA